MTTLGKLVNGVPVEDIINPIEMNAELVERIAERKAKPPELTIVEPDPRWPESFQAFKWRLLAAFEPDEKGDDNYNNDNVTILSINHVGSTSVPGLPAKAVIDIDLVLSSNTPSSEAFYVPCLEAAGFQFLLREPAWYGHRFFYAWEPMLCNLHVWGPRCPEVERHRIFRDRLRENVGDRELYARTKRESAALVRERGQGLSEYTARKDEVVGEVMARAFTELGYLYP